MRHSIPQYDANNPDHQHAAHDATIDRALQSLPEDDDLIAVIDMSNEEDLRATPALSRLTRDIRSPDMRPFEHPEQCKVPFSPPHLRA